MAEHTITAAATNKAPSWVSGPIVKIIVGEDTDDDPRTFFVHAEILTSRSAFFAKALKNYAPLGQTLEKGATPRLEDEGLAWREGQEGLVRLPVDEPDVFANYVQLIYTGTLPIFGALEDPKEEPNVATQEVKKQREQLLSDAIAIAIYELYWTLTKLYVFSDKVQDVTSKRTLLASFFEASSTERNDGFCHYPEISHVCEVYTSTLMSDPLQDFMVDCYVLWGKSNWIVECHHYPPEFCYAVMLGMMKKQEGLLEDRALADAKYYQNKLDELEKEKDADENQS